MKKVAPYILSIGLFCIVVDGLWIVESYDSIVSYPREAFVFLVLGMFLIVISYFLFKFSNPLSVDIQKGPEYQRDNRVYVQKMWDNRELWGGRLLIGILIVLAIISIYNFALAVRLLFPILFCGMVVVAFLYAMYHDDMEMEDDEQLKPKTAKVRKLMSLIDYRNISLACPCFYL